MELVSAGGDMCELDFRQESMSFDAAWATLVSFIKGHESKLRKLTFYVYVF